MTAAICAWCLARSNMTQVSNVAEGQRGTELWVQAAFSCAHCHRLSIGSTAISSRTATPSSFPTVWWDNRSISWTPQKVSGRDFPDVPEHIASAADEAYRCHSIDSFRSAILLARSVLEATCKDNKVTKGSLANKIEAMASAGLIRKFTRVAADELRFLGNDMAHGDFVEPVDAEDSESVLDIMAEVLNEVYQGPARVARMQAKRKAGLQEDETITQEVPSRSSADFTGTLNI